MPSKPQKFGIGQKSKKAEADDEEEEAKAIKSEDEEDQPKKVGSVGIKRKPMGGITGLGGLKKQQKV